MKSCPKGAFLGLCEMGLVKGIPGGHYTKSSSNKKYALDAVAELRRNPKLLNDSGALWSAVMERNAKSINQNNQMDVVIALWINDLIVS